MRRMTTKEATLASFGMKRDREIMEIWDKRRIIRVPRVRVVGSRYSESLLFQHLERVIPGAWHTWTGGTDHTDPNVTVPPGLYLNASTSTILVAAAFLDGLRSGFAEYPRDTSGNKDWITDQYNPWPEATVILDSNYLPVVKSAKRSCPWINNGFNIA